MWSNPTLIPFAIVLGSLGCHSNCQREPASRPIETSTRDPGLAELIAIQHADPATALDAAWNRGDEQFLAVAGFSVEPVGVDGPEYVEIVDKQGMRVISGTTDTPVGEEHVNLIMGAREYVRRYNRLLLRRLEQEGRDKHQP